MTRVLRQNPSEQRNCDCPPAILRDREAPTLPTPNPPSPCSRYASFSSSSPARTIQHPTRSHLTYYLLARTRSNEIRSRTPADWEMEWEPSNRRQVGSKLVSLDWTAVCSLSKDLIVRFSVSSGLKVVDDVSPVRSYALEWVGHIMDLKFYRKIPPQTANKDCTLL